MHDRQLRSCWLIVFLILASCSVEQSPNAVTISDSNSDQGSGMEPAPVSDTEDGNAAQPSTPSAAVDATEAATSQALEDITFEDLNLRLQPDVGLILESQTVETRKAKNSLPLVLPSTWSRSWDT